MTVFYIFLGFLAVTVLDVPHLIKNKNIKELVIYSSILVLAFIISVLHVTRIVRFDWIKLIEKSIQLFIKM